MGKKWTREQQFLIGSLLLFIAGLYYYFNYMISPVMKKIDIQKIQYTELQAQIQEAEREARRLPILQAQSEKLIAELSQLEKQLPKDKDIPNVLRTLTKEALRENLRFVRVSPGRFADRQYFEIIPFDIQFTGSVHSFIRFLATLGQQDRIYKAGNITFTPSGGKSSDGEVALNIQVSIETYAYKG